MLVTTVIILGLVCFFGLFWGIDKSDEIKFLKRQVELLEAYKRLYLKTKYRNTDRKENKKRSIYIRIGNIITIVKR